MKVIAKREFANGVVYALRTDDGFSIEVTDTFLPYYTKNSVNGNNKLKTNDIGSRKERWMIGISTMSGCPCHCEFCATGMLKKYRNLTAQEMIDQVEFILAQNPNVNPNECKEFKINWTRMGEPFLNIENVREAIEILNSRYNVHQYVSTIGIKNSNFSWIKDNITLQISLHSLDEARRNKLIPIKNKMSIEELGQIRTQSNLKTTVNMTLVDYADFDIHKLKKYFDPEYFFIKLSPINVNDVSKENNLGTGIIETENLL